MENRSKAWQQEYQYIRTGQDIILMIGGSEFLDRLIQFYNEAGSNPGPPGMGYELLPGHTPGATGHMVLFTPQQVLVQSCLQCHRTQNINKKAKVERLYHCAKPTLHASHKTVKEITVSISTLYCKREYNSAASP